MPPSAGESFPNRRLELHHVREDPVLEIFEHIIRPALFVDDSHGKEVVPEDVSGAVTPGLAKEPLGLGEVVRGMADIVVKGDQVAVSTVEPLEAEFQFVERFPVTVVERWGMVLPALGIHVHK